MVSELRNRDSPLSFPFSLRLIFFSNQISTYNDLLKILILFLFLEFFFRQKISTTKKLFKNISSSLMDHSSTQSSEYQQNMSSNPPSLQLLNHVLPIKLDRNNYVLWKTQMENVVFVNGFRDYIDGTKKCPPKEIRSGEANPEFIKWRRLDRLILSWIYSTLT